MVKKSEIQVSRSGALSVRDVGHALHLTLRANWVTGAYSYRLYVAAVCRSGYYQLRQLGLSGRSLKMPVRH